MTFSGPYHPEHLWALMCTSPKRAATVAPGSALANCPTLNRPMDRSELVRWERSPGVPLAAWACVSGHYAYYFVHVQDASPPTVLDLIRSRGLHLRAAMVKDGLWRAVNRPMTGFVVVAVEIPTSAWNEHGHPVPFAPDHAEYVLGENLEREGEKLYQRALARLDEAMRTGWPGWKEKGETVLDVERGAEEE